LVESDITDVLKAMEQAGRAPNTIRTHWITVQAFLNWLVATKVLTVSCLGDVTVQVDPVADRTRDIVVPDFRFLDLLCRRLGDGEDRLVFELLLGTGGRRSEVAGMVVGDVDLAARRVWVREPVVEVEGRLVRNPTPKGGRDRAVVVGPKLAQLLREHVLRTGGGEPDRPLLVSPRGKGFRWNNYLARTLRPAIISTAMRWAAIERRRLINDGMTKADATAQALAEARKLCGLTPHHLRHTAAALLWAAGASDIEVQLILGHRDIETSKRLYAHLLRGSGESAAERVEQLREACRAS
jgi:integrase